MRNELKTWIDDSASNCSRCRGCRVEYRFATRYATRACLKPGCRHTASFDTTKDVKPAMKSLEQARAWFTKVYG